MDEIKPVEGALLVDGRVVLVDENYPAQRKEGASLYSQQAIDTLRADYDRAEELALQAIESRKEAEAEADALRKDAERYRWMRQDDYWEGFEFTHIYGAGGTFNLVGDELDAAVDAAMQAKPVTNQCAQMVQPQFVRAYCPIPEYEGEG